MSYTRSQVFQPGTFLRSCDICGIRFRANQLTRGEDGFWRCQRWCQEVPAITRDKISAQSQRRKEAPPPPHGIPYDQKDTHASEAAVFNFLAEMPVVDAAWATGTRYGCPPRLNVIAYSHGISSTSSYNLYATAEACRYFYDLIAENKRPSRWITVARSKLRELADWLLTFQSTTGTPDTNLGYGGWDGSPFQGGATTYNSRDTAACGIALLFAYLTFGDSKYIAGARAAAHMLRAFQWSAYASTFFTSSDSAGTSRLYTGGHCDNLTLRSAVLTFDSRFSLSGVLAIEFLTRLKAADGDATYGGLGNSGGQSFTVTAAATLTTAIADALSFWASGALDATTGTTVTGLSATTPRELFNAYPASKNGGTAGTGSWEFADSGSAATGTQISGSGIATALRSLYYVSGYTTQLASVYTWLMSFSSNPLFVGDAGTLATDYSITSSSKSANPPAPPASAGNVVAPSYNPKLALASRLLVRNSANGFAAIAQNGATSSLSTYDWSTAGLLAAISASQDAGSFRKAKDAMTTVRLVTPATYLASGSYPAEDTVMLRGASGLAFQIDPVSIFATTTTSWNTLSASLCGAVFRYQPQSWTGTNPPQQSPGVQV